MTRKKTTMHYVKSSGNVFADLGLPHPERALLKAGLTLQICHIIKARRLTDGQASEILGSRCHARRSCSTTGLGTSRWSD